MDSSAEIYSHCYATALRNAARKVSALYGEALRPIGVTSAQFNLLRAIDAAGGVSMTTLAVILKLDRSTIGRNVHLLHRKELVTLSASRDNREEVVGINAKGRVALEAGATLWSEGQSRIENLLGKDVAAALLVNLRRI